MHSGRGKNIARRTIKDSVFCDLFADPENQLKLYRFLHLEDKDVSLSDFTTVIINNVLTDQLYNDLGFTVRDKLLILAEAQSTWSISIILRIIMYLAQTLKEYITVRELNVYGSAKVINDQVKKFGRTEEAIREAIRNCKDQDILRKR